MKMISDESHSSRRHESGAGWSAGAMLFCCLALTVALFSPLLLSDTPFLCDDYTLVSTNLEGSSLSAERMLAQFEAPPYGVSQRYYRPLFHLSFAFDFLLGGAEPRVYYLMNCLYHGLTGWLLFMCLISLGAGRAWSTLAALVFLCHPVHIETVTWIAARSSSLAAIFTMGSLVCFVRYRRGFGIWFLFGCGVLFGLGLLTREVVVIVPAVVLAIDLLLGASLRDPEGRGRRGGWLHLLCPYLTLAIVMLLYLGAREHAVGGAASGYGEMLRNLAGGERVGKIVSSLSRHMVPVMASLNGNPALWMELLIGLPSALLILAALRLLWVRSCRGILLLAVVLFVLATLPSLPILDVSKDLMNSRLLYLASVGTSILLAAGGLVIGRGEGSRFFKLATSACLACVIVGGGGLLWFNQRGLIGAGKVCHAFLNAARESGASVLVVPRLEFFPYADREGEGFKNDSGACFAPAPEPRPEEESFKEKRDALSVLINLPLVVNGAYVFWGSVDVALLPLFGEPGIDVLYTELSTKLNREGSFFGPLLAEGVPVLKWNGEQLIPTALHDAGESSEVGRDAKMARAAPLGIVGLKNGPVFEAAEFRPIMELPVPENDTGAYRYRTLTTFGPNTVAAQPAREGQKLVFDPWNEAQSAPLFRALKTLKADAATHGLPLPDLDHIACLLYIEMLGDGRVIARTKHLLLRVNFGEG
ncbi:MAG: hypothetical protein V2A76_19140 [Planctomycetota bacterium]